jgi:cystathionine beta-lyase/cystathionine gamma-synthase
VSAIDNTFASPVNQRPIEMGIDLSMQSATKYLNGHSDVTAGVVSGREDLIHTIELARRKLGGVLDPQAAYALGRSMKTLPVRMERHNANGMAVASTLEGHARLSAVHYPGLASHPDHALAKAQMSGFGGMVCLEVVGGEEAACRVFDRLRVIKRAVSLGGVESVASVPLLTSHWGHSDAQLAEAGISKGMIRVSIGLEDPLDLIDDLCQALAF